MKKRGKAGRRVGKCIPRRAREGLLILEGRGGVLSLLLLGRVAAPWAGPGSLSSFYTWALHQAPGDFRGWQQTGEAQPGNCGDALPDGRLLGCFSPSPSVPHPRQTAHSLLL